MPRLLFVLLVLGGCGEARFELQNVRTETVMTAPTGATAGNVAGEVVNVGSAAGRAIVCSGGWNAETGNCDGPAIALMSLGPGERKAFAGGYVSRTRPPVAVFPSP